MNRFEAKRVQVLSEKPMPVIPPAPVNVHYFEAGQYKTFVDHMRVPTYFDKIVVSTVHEVAPGLPRPPLELQSPRGIALSAYRTARGIARSLRPARVITTPTLDTRRQPPNNMAHLLVDLIPYALYVRSIIGPDVTFLFRKLEKPYAELLEIFGIVPRIETGEVEADIVKVRGTRGLSVYDLLGTFDCTGSNFLPDVYETFTFPSSLKFEKIFLARRGPRRLGNQSELEAVVAKHGYKTIFMEDYSVSEQLSIGAHARHVVAIHGAAMAFLIGAKQIDSVIELLPANVYHAGYPVILSGRVGRYELIIPSFDQAVAHSGWQAVEHSKSLPFSVDARLLDQILSSIDMGRGTTAKTDAKASPLSAPPASS
jgi:hypothetical protein